MVVDILLVHVVAISNWRHRLTSSECFISHFMFRIFMSRIFSVSSCKSCYRRHYFSPSIGSDMLKGRRRTQRAKRLLSRDILANCTSVALSTHSSSTYIQAAANRYLLILFAVFSEGSIKNTSIPQKI